MNAGGWEDWRSDADAFPAPVLGEPLDDWEGERWLDTRQLDVLLPIMTARLDACAAKGCDAVDPDNVDGYGAETGFDLTRADTVAYVRALAEAAARLEGANSVLAGFQRRLEGEYAQLSAELRTAASAGSLA